MLVCIRALKIKDLFFTMKRYLTILSVLLTATACSSVSDMFVKPSPAFLSVEEAHEQIAQAPVCCNGDIFNSTNMVSITKTTDEDYLLDSSNAEAYNFPTGKSFFRIFQLPLNTAFLKVTINPEIITTVILPRIDFYNKDKVLISTLKSTAFKYRDKGFGNGYLEAKLQINNAAAAPGREFAYMVVYTTDENQKTTTSIMHPAVKMAIAQQKAVPELPNLQIPHAPIGTVNIQFTFKEEEKDALDNLVTFLDAPLIGGKSSSSNREENVVLATGEVYSKSSQSEGSTAVTSIDSKGNKLVVNDDGSHGLTAVNNTNATTTPNQGVQYAAPGSMLKESENMYNALIIEAIKAGDLAKAMNLVGEAQRAGSATAQSTFIDAVKNNKR